MPTYEYKCTQCNHVFEVFQKMSEEPLKECPKCKGVIRRLIGSGAGTIFKGSGFYQTDYKNKSTTTHTPKKENKEESKPSGNKSKSSDSSDKKKD